MGNTQAAPTIPRAGSESSYEPSFEDATTVPDDPVLGPWKQQYKVLRKLGAGRYSKVYAVRDRTSRALSAVKVVTKAKMTAARLVGLVREVEVLRGLGDVRGVPRLVRTDNSSKRVMIMAMELCEGEDLVKVFAKRKDVAEEDVAAVCRQMLEIVKDVHAAGVCHRDITPEKFLYRDEACSELALIDFSSAVRLPVSEVSDPPPLSLFVAPEALQKSTPHPSADIYSIGCVLHLLLSGTLPFASAKPKELAANIEGGRFDLDAAPWSAVSEEAKVVLRRMVDMDPGKRGTAAELMEDPWISSGESKRRILVNTLSERYEEYETMSRFKKVGRLELAYLAAQEKSGDLSLAFKAVDKDGSGKISRAELRGACESLDYKLTERELDALIRAFDVDVDGAISYAEFLAASAEEEKLLTIEKLRNVFNKFDADGDKLISPRELMEAHSGRLSREEIEAAIEGADKDGDGMINFEEFCELLTKSK